MVGLLPVPLVADAILVRSLLVDSAGLNGSVCGLAEVEEVDISFLATEDAVEERK